MPTVAPRTRLAQSWRSVRTIEAMIRANTGPRLYSLIPHATGFARVPESLLLLFGVSVLEEALQCLRDEGAFNTTRNELSALMKASKVALPWKDYDVMDKVRLRRNKVAHRGQLLEATECTNGLAAIAGELLAWGVLIEDPTIEYTVAFRPDA